MSTHATLFVSFVVVSAMTAPSCRRSGAPRRPPVWWWSREASARAPYAFVPIGASGAGANIRASANRRDELPDPLDAARHDVSGPQPPAGPGRRRKPRRRPGGDEVAGAQLQVPVEVHEHVADREAHVGGGRVLDRLAVEQALDAEIRGVELVGRD